MEILQNKTKGIWQYSVWIRHTLHTNTIQQPTPAASAWVENSAKAASLWKSSEVLLTNGYYKIPLYI